MECANYINGAFVETETYMDAIDPSTLEVIGAVPLSNSADVDKAVEAASAAFDSWSSLQPRQRAEYLFKIADEIDANMEELALLESRDQGKTVAAARMIDIPRAATNFRYFAESIISPKLDRVSYQSVPNVGEMTSVAGRVPVGVAALIAPWNLPLYLLSWKIAPAIGNTEFARLVNNDNMRTRAT